MRWPFSARAMPGPDRPEEAAPPRAVVFDVGGVLLDWDPRYLYRKLFTDAGAMEWFLAHVGTPAWHVQHDRGVSIALSCETLSRQHPAFEREIRAWAERGEEMVRGEIPEVADILAALDRNGVPCYALTNMERETYPKRRARFGFFTHFTGVMVSGEEGIVKPDPALFNRLLARYRLDASRTLFIDDSGTNVETARHLGFVTHRFEGADGLRQTLTHMGLLTF